MRSRDRVTRYRRSGSGPAVLLLQSSEGGGAIWPELPRALEDSYRLIVPDPPPGGTDIAHWLADFLEGLGHSPVAVLASDDFCMPVLELALLGADHVTRVVLVPAGTATETGLEGTLATSIRDEAVALLVVRRGIPAAEALPLVTRFLGGVVLRVG